MICIGDSKKLHKLALILKRAEGFLSEYKSAETNISSKQVCHK
jgi:hypothetical protein